jgi:hypothetical protein
MKKLIFILMLSFPVVLYAQPGGHKNSGNIRKDRPFGISACLGGGNLLGMSLDYFIIPQLNVEVGFGFSQYIALKYHFVGGEEINWSPYIGLGYGIPISTIREADERYSNGVIAVPIGVHFIQEKGFSFSVEGVIGIVHYTDQYSYNYDKPVDRTELFPSFGIRLGYHF